MSDSESYKAAKEAFVSNHSGSAFGDILLNLLFVPATALIQHTVAVPILRSISSPAIRFMVDWLFGVFPIIMSCMGESNMMRQMMLASMVLISLLQIITRRVSIAIDTKNDNQINLSLNTPRNKRFLIWYRSWMMMGTVVAILAVDFQVFPRKYAKVETWGISLMDIGVGSFIVASALVSARAQSSTPKLSWFAQLLRSMKGTALAAALGLVRFALVKAFDYQEHVTEYGKHWNFFMTLAAIPLLEALLPIPIEFASHIGGILLVIYEIILRVEGIQGWIIESPRGLGFLSDNREGILSLISYFSLYLIAQGIGRWLLQPVNKATARKEWWRRMWILFFSFASCWFIQEVLLDYLFGLRPSRRLCNMGYILLVLAGNLALLAHLLMLDLVLPVPRDPAVPHSGNSIIQAISTQRNSQLLVFIVANILTGITNLLIPTLYASTFQAVLIMCIYTLLVSLASQLMNRVALSMFSSK